MLTPPQRKVVAQLGATVVSRWSCGCVEVETSTGERVFIMPHGTGVGRPV